MFPPHPVKIYIFTVFKTKKKNKVIETYAV